MDSKLQIALLCRKMKWTYQQYRSQPAWMTEALHMMERLDADKQHAEDAKLEAESKSKTRTRGR